MQRSSAPSSSSLSAAAGRSDDDQDDKGAGLPGRHASLQPEVLQPATPAARVFVCENITTELGISRDTANAATQAEVESPQNHEVDTDYNEPAVHKQLPAPPEATQEAHKSQSAADAGVEPSGTAAALCFVLPGQIITDGDHTCSLVGGAPVSEHSRDDLVNVWDTSEPARKCASDADSHAAPAACTEPGVSIGTGNDSNDGAVGSAADVGSQPASGASAAQGDDLASWAADDLRFVVGVDGPDAGSVPNLRNVSGSLACDAHHDSDISAEAPQNAGGLSQQAMLESEAELEELAALAAQLQQVRTLALHRTRTRNPITPNLPLTQPVMNCCCRMRSTCSADFRSHDIEPPADCWHLCLTAASNRAQAVDIGDDVQLQASAPMAAPSDSLLSSPTAAAVQRSSLEDATLE